MPASPLELAAAARGAVAAGAAELHVHPRLPDGAETLAAAPCGQTIEEIRSACPGVPVGLTTAAWIDPDPRHRLLQISRWEITPDYVSVNFSEPGVLELCDWLTRRGIGIEAGLVTTADAGGVPQRGGGGRCPKGARGGGGRRPR